MDDLCPNGLRFWLIRVRELISSCFSRQRERRRRHVKLVKRCHVVVRVRVLSNRHVVPEILVEILSFSVMLRCNLYYEYVFFKYTRLFSISFILRRLWGTQFEKP